MANVGSQIDGAYNMLQRVWKQLAHLAHVDDVFWQVQAIIRANPQINVAEAFQDWIAQCYVDAVTIGLRRLADRRRGVVSLWRVLGTMLSLTTVLTKARYLSLHEEPLRPHAEEWWADLVGADCDHVPRDLILAKRAALERALEKVTAFADQNVAHSAASVTHAPTTFDDVRRSLVAAFSLYRWCSRILQSEDVHSPVPTIQTNWLQSLRVPWLPPSAPVPRYVQLTQILEEEDGQSHAAV